MICNQFAVKCASKRLGSASTVGMILFYKRYTCSPPSDRPSTMRNIVITVASVFVLVSLLGAFDLEVTVAAQDGAGEVVSDRKLLFAAIGTIQGGFTAKKGRFPYMTSLRRQDDSHACGGVLIDKSWVLTAAHCLDPREGVPLGLNPQVVLGALQITGGLDVEGVEVFLGEATLHYKWNGEIQNGFDIALIKLPRPSKFEPIRLPALGISLRTGKSLSIVGWGSVGNDRGPSNDLKWANVIHRENLLCNERDVWNNAITPGMICAGGTLADTADICAGDSGGPLMLPHMPGGKVGEGNPSLDVLIGISSFAEGPIVCGSNAITSRRPSVYTRVSEFLEWIDDVMNGAVEEMVPVPRAPPVRPLPKPGSNQDLLDAAWNGDLDVVKGLLSKGADKDARDKNGNSPVLLASWQGHFEIVDFLLDEGANVDNENKYEETALFFASSNNEIAVAKRLLKGGAKINHRDDSGTTSLILAAREGHVGVVEFLLGAGADKTLKDENGAPQVQICADAPNCRGTTRAELKKLLQ